MEIDRFEVFITKQNLITSLVQSSLWVFPNITKSILDK